MSVSQEAMEDTSESFWEVGQYKRTVKRVADGHVLGGDLANLVMERSEIEKAYAKQLRHWAKKWHDSLGKGPEYGTLEAAWRGVLLESEKLSEIHMKVKERLVTEVHTTIKQWQKDNYHKSMMAFKEVKEADEGFKKAQKPWSKRLDKVTKTKRDYHMCCKAENTALNQERNAQNDSAVSDDQKQRFADKVKKCKSDKENHKDRYQTALEEITSYNARYMEDMTEQFEKCQAIEKKRQEFFKGTLLKIHGCLDLSHSDEYDQVYADFEQTVMNADAFKDLRWWSNNHGVDMAMNWPTFQEYSPEMVAISRKSRREKEVGDGVTLTSINLGNKDEKEADPHQPITSTSASVERPPSPAYDPNLNPFGDDEEEEVGKDGAASVASSSDAAPVVADVKRESLPGSGEAEPALLAESTDVSKNGPATPLGGAANGSAQVAKGDGLAHAPPAAAAADTPNPFEEDEEEENGRGFELVDDGSPGKPVRALYDYAGAEADELTFSAGDLLDKLSEEDDQGWCKGRKDGVVGLYPANYCEEV